MKIFGVGLYFKSYRKQTVSRKRLLGRVGICFVFALFLFPQAEAQEELDVPYVSTPHNIVEEMLDVADVGPGDYVIDLGCGDGRIVIAAARRGAVGHGVDLDPERIREARENARRSGVSDRVMFLKENIFKTDISRASVVTMYLLSSVNDRLRPRLLDELEPGTRIVSHDFDMGTWTPDEYKKVTHADDEERGWKSGQLMEADNHEIYCWIVPADIEGRWNWQINGKNFTLNVEQKFQEIKPQLTVGGNSLTIEDKMLRGDRISLTAVNTADATHYVFNGRIVGNQIKGKVQIRSTTKNLIKDWSAVRN